MKKKLFFVFMSILSLGTNAQDLNTDYKPIEFTGLIPERFLVDLKEISNKELDSVRLSKKEDGGFYINSNQELLSLYRSGNVYFNDFISDYVNKVAKEITKNETNEIVKDLSFNVTKYPIANAFCWRSGDIFINIELFKYIENEAQLAFIICHEIQHFKNQHSLNFYKKEIELKKQKRKNKKEKRNYKEIFKGNEELFKEIEKMAFSKEQEFQADIEGFDLFLKSDYNKSEAIGALAALKKLDIADSRLITIDLKNFNNENYKIDSSKIWGKGIVDSLMEMKYDKEEDKELEIKLSSHPELDSRIQKIEEKLKDKSGKEFIISNLTFDKVQSLVDFEEINFYYENNFFYTTISLSLDLLNKYPENIFIQKKIAESLYKILLYSRLGASTPESKESKIYNQTEYLAYYLNKISQDQLENLVINYISTLALEHTEIKDLEILKAKALSITGNKAKSKKIFKDFNDKNNNNYNYAKTKEKIG